MYKHKHLFGYSFRFTSLYIWTSLKRLKKGRMLYQQIVAKHCKKTTRVCPIHFPCVFSADTSGAISHQLHYLLPTENWLEHPCLLNHAIHRLHSHTTVHSCFHGIMSQLPPHKTQNMTFLLLTLLLFFNALLVFHVCFVLCSHMSACLAPYS